MLLALLVVMTVFTTVTATPATAASPLPPAVGGSPPPPTPAPAVSGKAEEVPSLDTASSTTWREPNGSYRVTIKSAPFQWRNARGDWHPIDNSLVADHSSGEAFKNKSNSFEAELPASANGPLAIHVGTSSATLVLQGARGTSPSVNGSDATYNSALTDVDVHDSIKSGGLVETDTLESASAPTSLTWTLSTAGFTPHIEKDGSILLAGGEGGPVSILPPSVTDARGVSGPVTMTLTGNQLTVGIDPAWLHAADRAFPVALDPTVSGPASNFCMIEQASPSAVNCSESTPYAVGQSSSGSAQRLLFQEQYSIGQEIGGSGSVNLNIPTNAVVTSATMGFYVSGTTGSGVIDLAAYPINAYPDSGSYDGGYSYPTMAWNGCSVSCDLSGWVPGGDYVGAQPFDGTGSSAPVVANSWLLLHPLPAVQAMVKNTYGIQFELMATNESANPGLATVVSNINSSTAPYLTFDYTVPPNPAQTAQANCTVSPINPAVGMASAGSIDSYWIAEKGLY